MLKPFLQSIIRIWNVNKARKCSVHDEEAAELVGIFVGLFKLFQSLLSDELALDKFIYVGDEIIPVQILLSLADKNLSDGLHVL